MSVMRSGHWNRHYVLRTKRIAGGSETGLLFFEEGAQVSLEGSASHLLPLRFLGVSQELQQPLAAGLAELAKLRPLFFFLRVVDEFLRLVTGLLLQLGELLFLLGGEAQLRGHVR